MGPRGFGGFCLALLCSGAALGFQEEEPGNGSVAEDTPEGTGDPLEPPGHPSTASGDGEAVTTWPRAATTPWWSGGTAGTAAGNQTRVSAGVPARYWSPVLFVALALLVLFVTYHRNKGKGSRDWATSGSDSSDLGALVQPHAHHATPKIPTLRRESTDPEPPKTPEHSETPFNQPDPPQAPPDSPPGGS